MSIKKNINTQILIQTILTIFFITNIFISEISNYKPYSFYLKGISSIILLILCWIDFKFNIGSTTKKFQLNNKRMLAIKFLFVFLPTISLLYSHNIELGIMKVIYILISVIPSIFVFLYFLQTSSRDRVKIFLNTILFIGLLFGLVSLIFSPYNPTTWYSFELSRWSHVIAGRFLSIDVVIILLLHFSSYVKSKFTLVGVSTILLVSTYFVGLRAAFLGIIILIIALVIFSIISKKKEALLSISISLFFSIIVIFLVSQLNATSTNRYSKLQTNEVGKFDDGAINARLIAYEVSWKNIKKHPVLGIGFGGFNNKEISGDIATIKYPHNLLIEIQLELGLIGSIFFGVLLGLMFWRAYKFSIPIFIFLLFSFWLAMFSKDISTQTQLWIGIALWGIKEKAE